MAASFVLRRFAGMFHQHRLRGFFDERFTDSSRDDQALWFHIRKRAGALRSPRRKASPAADAARATPAWRSSAQS